MAYWEKHEKVKRPKGEMPDSDKWKYVDAARRVADGDFEYEDVEIILRGVLDQCEESTIRGFTGLGSGYNIFGDSRTALLIATTALQILDTEEVYSAIKQAAGDWDDPDPEWYEMARRSREYLAKKITENKKIRKKNLLPGSD
jgi:hypothetical protein